MTLTIWKYPLAIGTTELEMPLGARVLCVQMQRDTPQIWVMVDPNAKKVKRMFTIRGTGHDISDLKPDQTYIGTFQVKEMLVFHVFEIEA